MKYKVVDTVTGGVNYDSQIPEPGPGKSEYIKDESDNQWRKAKRDGTVLMRYCDRRVLTRSIRDTTHRRSVCRESIEPPFVMNNMVDQAENLSAFTYLGHHMMSKYSVDAPDWSALRDSVYPWSDPHWTQAYTVQRLLEQAYADAGKSEALIPVSIAEFAKTRVSIGRLRSLIPRFRQWIRENEDTLLTRRSAFRLSRKMESQWLEYRFGFMQLYYDVKSLQKAWKRIGSNKITYSAREIMRSVIPATETVTVHSYDTDTVRINKMRNDTITAGVVCEPVLPCLDAVRALGLDKPLTTMWELTRLSWVVDRFINVSQTLGALEGKLLRSIDGSWTSVKTECAGTFSFQRDGRDGSDSNVRVTCKTKVVLTDEEKLVQYVRVPNPPYPYLLPELRFNLNLEGAVDLVALLQGLSKTLKPRLK